jgi:RNA polymerase sigma-70 factor (ECF subfamily)
MRAGDRIAVHEFFVEVSPWVRRVARRWLSPGLRRVTDSDDVAASVLRRALAASHRVQLAGEAQALAWLATIVRNRVRTLARRAAGPLAGSVELGEGPRADARSFDPAALAEDAEEVRRFHLAVAGLAPDERESILLHDLRGLSHAEVAECLGRPGAEAARKLHARAWDRLRERLDPDRP